MIPAHTFGMFALAPVSGKPDRPLRAGAGHLCRDGHPRVRGCPLGPRRHPRTTWLSGPRCPGRLALEPGLRRGFRDAVRRRVARRACAGAGRRRCADLEHGRARQPRLRRAAGQPRVRLAGHPRSCPHRCRGGRLRPARLYNHRTGKSGGAGRPPLQPAIDDRSAAAQRSSSRWRSASSTRRAGRRRCPARRPARRRRAGPRATASRSPCAITASSSAPSAGYASSTRRYGSGRRGCAGPRPGCAGR